MQNSNNLDSLLSSIPVDDLAKKFDVDPATMEAAVQQALPALVGGMAVNASDESGAQKLSEAVGNHQPVSGKLDLNAVDTADGEKIVNHVLGDKQQDVTEALGAMSDNGGIAKLIPMLLPILAPIVMQFLSGKQQAQGSEGSGGLGDVLGDLLGGLGGGQASGGAAGGGLGDILGGLLGGGQGSSGGGGLGDLLGGLLGGNK